MEYEFRGGFNLSRGTFEKTRVTDLFNFIYVMWFRKLYKLIYKGKTKYSFKTYLQGEIVPIHEEFSYNSDVSVPATRANRFVEQPLCGF